MYGKTAHEHRNWFVFNGQMNKIPASKIKTSDRGVLSVCTYCGCKAQPCFCCKKHRSKSR